ncbi:MAG: DUF1801 domain-containing protein [Bacteroidota bacterium]
MITKLKMDTKITSIDNYIIGFPAEVQVLLVQIRNIIRQSAPSATEKISYAMPTFALHGNLIHFAAYQNHIGLYPAPKAIEAFKTELSTFKTSKGAIQFPLNKPIPLDLIARITKFNVAQQLRNKEIK